MFVTYSFLAKTGLNLPEPWRREEEAANTGRVSTSSCYTAHPLCPARTATNKQHMASFDVGHRGLNGPKCGGKGSSGPQGIVWHCSEACTVKAKFHWDQFLVANVTKKSPTSYGLVTRKSSMSGVSPTCYEEVGDVANKSARKLRGS